MNTWFQGIFDNELTNVIEVGDFLLCLFTALVIGLIMAMAYMWKNEHTGSFLITIALLPAVVCVVIMMVNGNIGTGVAVAGAFSLVRFRSAPGTAKEIVTIFFAMGAGLIAGMGYLGFAVLFSLIMCIILATYNFFASLVASQHKNDKMIKITIPEDLDYSDIFEDIFSEYTKKAELVKVKTTNMGSMFSLTYQILLKDSKKEKQLIDRIRERNGNLEIMVSRCESDIKEL